MHLTNSSRFKTPAAAVLCKLSTCNCLKHIYSGLWVVVLAGEGDGGCGAPEPGVRLHAAGIQHQPAGRRAGACCGTMAKACEAADLQLHTSES